MSWLLPEIPAFDLDSRQGNRQDIQFLEADKWLLDTEVRYIIVEKKRRWYVTMIFISIENPFQFFCRFISHYDTKKKALNNAQLLQRGIQKDARGTLKTKEHGFNICHN